MENYDVLKEIKDKTFESIVNDVAQNKKVSNNSLDHIIGKCGLKYAIINSGCSSGKHRSVLMKDKIYAIKNSYSYRNLIFNENRKYRSISIKINIDEELFNHQKIYF